MRRFQFLPILLLIALMLSSASVATVVGQEGGPPTRNSKALALRTETVSFVLAQKDVFDCATYRNNDAPPILPAEQQIFNITRDVKITPDDGKEYLAAFWSPLGDMAVFSVPGGESRAISPDDDTLPSDDETWLVGISKNELILYSTASNAWEPITSDGSQPTWSSDGQSVYYMAGTEMMKYDWRTHTSIRTGLSAPQTSVGLLLSRPLPDGRLLAQRQPRAPLEVQGGTKSALASIGVASKDIVLPSPSGERVVVHHGSNNWKGQFTPSLAVLHQPDGQITPFLKNCPYAATRMAWSPTGNQIAFPVLATHPEIRIYDIRSGQTQVLVRLNRYIHLGELSWSPDGKYLAYTVGDGSDGERSIWIAATDGAAQQLIVKNGLVPNWSPDGKHILYARYADPSAKRLFDWNLLEISSATQTEGAKSK